MPLMRINDPNYDDMIRKKILKNIKLKNGCWEWQKSTYLNGYARIGYKNKWKSLNRLSYLLFRGEIPKNMCVCHKCDNPLCVNPYHYWIGTHAENMRDMKIKGRSYNRNGEKNSFNKMTNEKIKELRCLRKKGYSYSQLMKKFNIAKTTVANIIHKRTWNHIRG